MESKTKTKNLFNAKFTLNKNMRDYGECPAFKKKHEEAVAFFEKNGLPPSMTNRGKKKK